MKGFTLIELLVVVIIIGILASIALPQYELVVEKSRASEALVNAKAILDAMQRHDQEFPGEAVTSCTQIADVQLKGGSWGSNCSTASATNATKCPAAGASVFSTKKFCYDIGGTSVTVTRKDGSTSLYAVSYTKPTGGNTSVASAGTGCEADADYEQVCKLFTDL